MATIISRTFSDGPDAGVRLGVHYAGVTGSGDCGIYRPLGFGTNWRYIRMGILCAINSPPSESYGRHCGLLMGICSANRVINASYAATGLVAATGNATTILNFTSYTTSFCNDPISGSFFYSPIVSFGGFITGTFVSQNGSTNSIPLIANLGDAKQRRSIVILEISKSAQNVPFMTLYGVASSSVYLNNGNRHFTAADLMGALTSSTSTALSASGVGLNRIVSPAITGYTGSLDTAFVSWMGGIPFEIYDWYIYKLA